MLHALKHALGSAVSGHPFSAASPSVYSRFASGAWDGFKSTTTGNLVMVPIIGLEAANAKRGETLPTITSEAAGVAVYPFFSAITCGILSAAFPGVIAPWAASVGGMVLAGIPDMWFVGRANRALRWFSAIDRTTKRIETGSRWRDSESSRQMRVSAVADMNSTLGASRRFLGQESLYYHDF